MPSEASGGVPRIALAGWFGSDNLGDELILSSLGEAVKARGAEVLAVSIRDDSTIQGIDSVPHRSPAQHLSLVRELRSCDAMAVAGGVIQAETSPWNLPFHLSRLQAAGSAGCQVAAVGMGVGDVSGRLGRNLVRIALRRAHSLVVRDHESAERLRCWGLPGAEVGADPTLALNPPPVEPDDTMCVILRHVNQGSLRTAASKGRALPDEEWLSGLAQAIDAVADSTGLLPRFVAFQASRDAPLHRAVANRLSVSAELTVPTLCSVLSEVARSRLVITMRYHGAVTALLHSRPAVLLDYSPKMASLASEGWGDGWAPTVDPRCVPGNGLVEAANTAFDSGERIPHALTALRSRLNRNDIALDALIEHSSGSC